MTSVLSVEIGEPQGTGGRRECEREAEARLLRQAMGDEASLAHYADGAPYVEGRPDIYISLSHSSTTCVLAVSDAPIGVDIESPRRQLVRVARKFVAECETGQPGESETDTMDRLLHLWTAKEAVYKLMRSPGLPLLEIIVSPSMEWATACGRECRLSFSRRGSELLAVATFTESHS